MIYVFVDLTAKVSDDIERDVSVTFLYNKKSICATLQSAPGVFQSVTGMKNEKLMKRSLMQPCESVHQTTICHIPFDTSVISLKLKPP